MNSVLLTVLLVSIIGANQFKISKAQDASSPAPARARLTTTIRIQSCNDNAFVGIPPLNGPPTTTTTMPPPPSPTTEDPATPTTTKPPIPVQPVPGGGTGNLIIYWKVNWASAVRNGTGSVIAASDPTTRENRCLTTQGADGIGALSISDIPDIGDTSFTWNFIARFDPVTWTYQYRIQHKESGKCLKKASGKGFTLEDFMDPINPIEFLYNILS